MKRRFTNAAQRAIEAATKHSAGGRSEPLRAPALLLGLLAETECRAALVLAQCGIDAEAVQRRWPELLAGGAGPEDDSPGTASRSGGAAGERSVRVSWSVDMEQSLAAVESCLREHWLDSSELGTEHLLLGLAVADHEVGVWLRRQGLQPGELEAEICQRAGVLPGAAVPLEVEPDETTEAHGNTTPTQPQVAENASGGNAGQGPPACRGTQQNSGKPCDQETGESGTPAVAPAGSASANVDLLRVLDAAANRCREGLRVLEDYVRFVLDDRHLTEQFKLLRHDLATALGHLPERLRLAARHTPGDVGTGLTTSGESRRDDPSSVLSANSARVTESLRSLEEFGKLFGAHAGSSFKQLRYRFYTLEKALGNTRTSAARLADVRLYVLVDGRSSQQQFARLITAVLEAGADMIQLRDKHLDDRQLLSRARLLRELTREKHVRLVVNDRPDLALLADADGVHVGQSDLPVRQARRIVGADRLVGVSTHSIEQARQAVLDGADYIGVGPTFPSSTKQFSEFPGLELLGAVNGEIRLPAFAIGGITPENLPQVLQTGIRRVAVSGAVLGAEDPAAVVRAFRAALRAD